MKKEFDTISVIVILYIMISNFSSHGKVCHLQQISQSGNQMLQPSNQSFLAGWRHLLTLDDNTGTTPV